MNNVLDRISDMLLETEIPEDYLAEAELLDRLLDEEDFQHFDI